MITPRQKTRLDAEAPVLFSLPNLHGASLQGANLHDANIPGTVEGLAASSSRTRVVPESPDVQLRIDRAETSVPAPMSHVSENRSAAIVDVSTPIPMATAVASAARGSHGRSWMERVGSRLILLVTLMVIVTAAWVTGQRMPASKLDNWNDPALTQTTPVHEITPPVVIPSNIGVEPAEVVEAIATIPNAPLESEVPDAMTATLTTPPTAISGSLQASTSVYKPVADIELPAIEEDVASIFNSVSLQGPQTGTAPSPAFDNVEPITLAPPTATSSTSLDPTSLEPASANSASRPPASPTHGAMTKTPLEPTFDPNVLLPWLSEQTASIEHLKSATPNAVDDWSQYLPDPQPNTSLPVRAASAIQPPNAGSTTQQAAYPPGVMTNPYSR